jgi:GT2 family glycosyltransferase
MIISTDFLRKLVEFMEKTPEAGVVKGRQALTPGLNWLATLELYSRSAGRMVDYQSKKGRFKVIGTAGALYRLKAANQVGGFDPKLRRYNEDWDIELKMRKAGWTMHTLGVSYLDYERGGMTWSALWTKYWIRGYYTTYFLKKNKGLIKHFRMFPPAAFVSGIFNSRTIFKMTGKKLAFLLPFQSAFKMSAWYMGFMRSRMDSYDQKLQS